MYLFIQICFSLSNQCQLLASHCMKGKKSGAQDDCKKNTGVDHKIRTRCQSSQEIVNTDCQQKKKIKKIQRVKILDFSELRQAFHHIIFWRMII